jgi:signal transduction histidine kinase/CheY-like chemotaxis protein/CHASE3 domain sensor protein
MKFKFEIRSIVLLLCIFLLVIITGIYVNVKISTTIDKVSIQNKADKHLVLLKSLSSKLIDAQNQLYSFNLTRDKNYLNDYYHSIREAQKRLNTLKNLKTKDEEQKRYTDSIEILVFEKFNILDSLMLIQNNYRVSETLEIVTDKFAEISNLTQPTNKEKKKFRSIFKREKSLSNSEMNFKVDYFANELKEIKNYEGNKELKNNALEFTLIQYDKFIMQEIAVFIDKLSKKEKTYLAGKALIAKDAAKDAKQITQLFSFLTSLLLILIFYNIKSYVKKNNKYKNVLKEAKLKSDELAAAKERFLSNMSHELKTPLISIIGFTDLLTREQTDFSNQSHKEKLSIIQKSANYLLSLINEILDHAKLQNGKVEFIKESFLVNELIQEIVDMLEETARKRGNFIQFQADHKQLIVVGDSAKLKQVLLNLIGNAIKFTENGNIILTYKPISANKGDFFVEFKISDNGIGIEKDRLYQIFNEFEQENVNTSKDFGGTGLGLNICKTIIELQGGKIDVESTKGTGTTFTFSLPFELGNALKVQTKTSEKGINLDNIHGKSILIVDDEAYNRRLLESVLYPYDVNIHTATNGLEAVELAENNIFHLILMDIKMPKMNGIEASQKIKSLRKVCEPIIALTAGTLEDNAKNENYFDGFISKPFDNQEFLIIISQLLVKNEAFPEKKQSKNKSTLSNENNLYNLTDLRESCNGNSEFFQEMLDLFIQSNKDGLQEMKECIDQNDIVSLSLIAHKISSPSKHIKAMEIYNLLKRIELYKKENLEIKDLEKLVKDFQKQLDSLIPLLEKENFEEK